jgi:hypothetical protein
MWLGALHTACTGASTRVLYALGIHVSSSMILIPWKFEIFRIQLCHILSLFCLISITIYLTVIWSSNTINFDAILPFYYKKSDPNQNLEKWNQTRTKQHDLWLSVISGTRCSPKKMYEIIQNKIVFTSFRYGFISQACVFVLSIITGVLFSSKAVAAVINKHYGLCCSLMNS